MIIILLFYRRFSVKSFLAVCSTIHITHNFILFYEKVKKRQTDRMSDRARDRVAEEGKKYVFKLTN